MAVTMIVESGVDKQKQMELVNKYSELRQANDVDGIMAIVTDDVTLESAMTGTVSGRAAFKEYLKSKPTGPGFKSEAAEMKDGIAQCKGKAKLLFVPISFVAKFQILDDPTSDGELIEKIVLSRS